MKLFLTLLITIFTLGLAYAQPSPDFNASPLIVCVGEEVQFEDLSTSSGTITSWTWDFGDGNNSTDENPTHIYTNSGLKTVILTVQDENGSEAEVKLNFITVNPLPSPSFDINILEGCSLPGEVSIQNVQPASGVSYEWSFGNGETSLSGNPSAVEYNGTGSYDISLIVEDDDTGCRDTMIETINIFDHEVDFSFSTTPICLGNNINFSDESSPGTDQWLWDFGNGSNSSFQNPMNTYLSEGTYTLTLTAINTSNGCSDSYSEEVEVLPLPSPSFDFNPASGCAPLEVDFTNTSSGSGSYQWSFGDGDTFSGENPPPHIYNSNGSYSVTLTQTDDNGCSNSTTVSNAINVSSISAQFNADVQEGCEALEVNFSNLSNSPNIDDPITGWEWDFGNGSVSNLEDPPAQTYNEGVYDVTLTVTTDAGCTNTITLSEYISVGVPPNVDFSWDPPLDCAKEEWNFDNLTTIPVPFDSTELEFQWDFGDDGTSGDVHPTYDYPQDTGYFDVQLIVLFRGCADTMIYDSAVYVDAPIALFNVENGNMFCNESIPLEVTFNDEAIIGEVTDDAEMIWDWGDGSSETIIAPNVYNNNPGQITHEYNSLGQYDIKQVVHNYTTGCSDSITIPIDITRVDAAFSLSNDSTCVNSQFSLTDNGSSTAPSPLYNITNFNYDFGNGDSRSGANVNYTYNTPGTTPGAYDITLTVTNNVGCQGTQVFNDFQVLALPQAVISPSDNAGCSGLTVEFANNSNNPSGVPLSSFEWTFDDGTTQTTTSIGETTEYTFTGEGVDTTRLVVTDEFGCVSPVERILTELTKPTANFSLPVTVCNFEEFTAINNSADYISSEWFLNSSVSPVSTNDEFTTSLNHIGSDVNLSFTDQIELIVTDANNCKDTLIQNINVSTPYADFDYDFGGANVNASGEFVCPPVFADLTDLSDANGSITNWNWDFGDGKTSTLENPNNTYVFAGTYTGTLIITDDVGCTDTVVYQDYLTIGGPMGELEWTSVGSLCDPEFTFTPVELDGVSDIMWAFGNGDTINSIEELNYSYEGEGTFYPTATLINEDGCNVPYVLDPISIETNILDAFFEVDPLTVNWNEPVFISDFSAGGYGGIVEWDWSTGNDEFSNDGESFEYLFNESGQVNVSLTVTDTAGCKDTHQVTVTVTDILTIPNVLTPNGDNSNDELRLIDNVYKSYTVTILNRWGNVVQETFVEDDDYLWDGLNRDKQLCTEGVYFYKISGTQRDGEPRQEHGFVHLITP